MKLTFLGTAAANAYPEAFCSCLRCVAARDLGGPSLRLRSSLLINDDLLIDLGPDIMASAQHHRIALTGVSHWLQTHPHADHLDLSHLQSRSSGYGTSNNGVLHGFATRETWARADALFVEQLEAYSMFSAQAIDILEFRLTPVLPLQPFVCGQYRATAFPATHAPGMGAVLYAVEQGSRAIFYGTDTGVLQESVWQAFQDLQIRFDVVVLDHTYGPDQASNSDHMGAHDVIATIARMRREGVLKPGGRVFGTHIAHEGNPPHPQLQAFAEAHGYEIAHDGLIVQV